VLASAEGQSSAFAPGAPVGGEPSNAAAAVRLATQARALLRAGRAREGLTSARAAVDADPTLAEAYVLVAAGLEDMGRWREAHHTYLTCVDHTGSAECSYFAARPR
jgi:Flp pilus assembly protein TadD